MPTKPHCTAALLWLACVLLAALTLALSGCTPLSNLDQVLWGKPAETLTMTKPDGTVITQTTDPGRPGLIDVIATGLAAFGFGGMGLWLRKVRNCANGHFDQLDQRLAAIEERLTKAP